MPFDSLMYKSTAKELDRMLSGGRIERVGMPDKDNVLISVRRASAAGRDSKVLLLSADPAHPRVHITELTAGNPPSAFSFLMHLRKHIGGGTILSVSSLPRERVVTISIEAGDELGYKKNYMLYAEAVGRYPNIILTDRDGRITDSLRHVGLDEFSARAVLPGLPYSPPPAQANKVAPDDEAALARVLDEYPGGKVADYLMTRIYGYAPATMKQLVADAFGTLTPTAETVRGGAKAFLAAVKKADEAFDPCVMLAGEKIKDVMTAPFTYDEFEFRRYQSLSEAVEAYFSSLEKAGFVSGRIAPLAAVVNAAVKKADKSLAVYREQALAAEGFEDERLRGELLTANIYRVKQGMSSVTVDNYYTGRPEEIPLDPTLSPQKNAQRYFKAYNKKKTAIAKSKEMIAAAEERLDYLDSLLAALSLAENEADINGIEAEMESSGLIKKSGARRKTKPSGPLDLTIRINAATSDAAFEESTPSGKNNTRNDSPIHNNDTDPSDPTTRSYKMSIGKNNVQNDSLVRNGDGGWLWLHTQKIHGSHGIIKATNVPQDVINEAAAYVAYYSKASMSANVPVDYTLLKYVKKPSGALPGKVIYTHQQTVNVTPRKPTIR